MGNSRNQWQKARTFGAGVLLGLPAVTVFAATGDDTIVGATECPSIAPDRAPTVSAEVSLWCLRAFVPAAIAGALITLSAPVAFVRVLGIVALAGSLLGVLLHAVVLQRDHPAAWNAWRDRWRSRLYTLQSRLGWSRSGTAPGAATAHENWARRQYFLLGLRKRWDELTGAQPG